MLASSRSRLASATVLAFGLSLCVSQARAYCRTTTCDAQASNSPACKLDADGCASQGIPLYWPARCIPLGVNGAGSEILGVSAAEANALVSRAASRWMQVDCQGRAPSLKFADQGIVACDRVEFNPEGPNANVVVFRDDVWAHDALALASTTLTFDVETGEIRGVDIEVNSRLVSTEGLEGDLETILTHELGHALGLAHSSVPGALMNAEYAMTASAVAAAVTGDDANAVCAVYPPGHAAECAPAKSFDSRCGGSVEGSCASVPTRAGTRVRCPGALLGALLCVALLVRRRRRAHLHANISS